MALQDKDILIASLIGSKAVKQVPRLAVVQNEMQKRVGIPIPIVPFKNVEKFAESYGELTDYEVWKANPTTELRQFFSLKIRKAGEFPPSDKEKGYFTLPFEPLISISGKNNIVKRSVAKAPHYVGTVKEHWSQDDYQITITGSLYGKEERGGYEETFPRDDFETLHGLLTAPEGLDVLCEPLQFLGINNIVIEDFSFPFTKGENMQAYDIKAISDFSTDFLLELED